MAKIHVAYDLELQNVDLNWFEQSRMHVMWRKPAMHVTFRPVK